MFDPARSPLDPGYFSGSPVEKEKTTNKRAGLWLDDNKAVIVCITDNGEEIKRFISTMQNYIRYSKSAPGDGSPEEPRDKRYWNHVGEYYDSIIAHIRGAKAIQIFGPGEAKLELKKRLENAGLAEFIVSVDEAEKLTDLQIARQVRLRFPAKSQYDIS
jgi:hypothetical protein